MELQWFRCWKMLGELYEPKGLALETACAVSKLDWQPKHPERKNKVASDEACRD